MVHIYKTITKLFEVPSWGDSPAPICADLTFQDAHGEPGNPRWWSEPTSSGLRVLLGSETPFLATEGQKIGRASVSCQTEV